MGGVNTDRRLAMVFQSRLVREPSPHLFFPMLGLGLGRSCHPTTFKGSRNAQCARKACCVPQAKSTHGTPARQHALAALLSSPTPSQTVVWADQRAAVGLRVEK